jgi:phage shock protein PspC (stress-responsive transcriptional regulator)
MNNIFHINLGGIPLTIDEDAYQILKDYLLELHKHFEGSDEKEEITDGIEQRLGEIISDKQSSGQIVNIAMVEHAINLMGRPSDFQEEETTESTNDSNTESTFKWESLNFGRRLFRDPDDNVLGGVCSGLSAYLGIKDPVFVRILFLILIFGFGVSVFFYLLLWIIIPEAKSNSDRLEMRGEPVNVDNLSKIITEQANRIGKKFQDLGDDLSGKMGKKSFMKTGVSSESFNIQNDLVKNIIQGIQKGFIALKKVIGSAGLFYFTVLWVLLFVALQKGYNALDLLPNSSTSSNLFTVVSMAMMIGLPIFYLGYKCSQLIFKSKLSSTVSGFLVGLWIASLCTFSYIITKKVTEYKKSSTVSETVQLNKNYDAIRFTGVVKPFINHKGIQDITIDIDNGMEDFLGFETDIQFKESQNGKLYYQIDKTARGKDEKLSRQRAEAIDLKLNQENNNIEIPLNLQLAVNDKFVAQSGKITIFIPKGTKVSFDNKVIDRVPYFADKENCSEFTLSENGFICPSSGQQDYISEPAEQEEIAL